MRIVASFVLLGAACLPFRLDAAVHESRVSSLAPADEYFGRLKESILEIRNRLDALDRLSDAQMLQAKKSRALDTLHDALRDWQREYPADPWLRPFLHRLARDYARAVPRRALAFCVAAGVLPGTAGKEAECRRLRSK